MQVKVNVRERDPSWKFVSLSEIGSLKQSIPNSTSSIASAGVSPADPAVEAATHHAFSPDSCHFSGMHHRFVCSRHLHVTRPIR